MEGTIGPAGDPNEPYEAPGLHHVLEITDLLVPAGTDWSADPQIIGTLAFDRAVGIRWVLAIAMDRDPDPSTAFYLGFVQTNNRPLSDTTYQENVFAVPGGSAGTNYGFLVTAFAPGFDQAARRTYDVGIWTAAGATPADITIVRARAAFQVI